MFTSSFNLDLSEASIIEIIDAFVDFKRKFNPNYKSLNLRSVILRAEETFKCEFCVPPLHRGGTQRNEYEDLDGTVNTLAG